MQLDKKSSLEVTVHSPWELRPSWPSFQRARCLRSQEKAGESERLHKVQIIALDLGQADSVGSGRKISFDQLLAHRLKLPDGIPPVTLDDIEKAIRQRVLDGHINHAIG